MPSEPARLSKSRYLSGLQCHKQLWWRVHEPAAPELSPSPGEQNRFAQGREVGEHARGHVPGGELIDLPYYQYDNKVAATREALNRGLPAIYEAWFLADETYVGVDILERASRGYTVIEVKASNSRKPEHLPDATVQVHVLRRAGLQVERAELMHLNSQCRYPDLSNLFVREDVTALVEAALIGVPDELAAQQRMLEGPLPDVAIGEHCDPALAGVPAVAAGAGAVQRACGARGRIGASSVDRGRAGGSASRAGGSTGRGVRGGTQDRSLPRELRARVHQAAAGGGATFEQGARADREAPGGLVARDPEACIPPGLRGRAQHQEDAAGAGAGTVLRGSNGRGRRRGDGGAAAADVPGRRDARRGAGRTAGGVAALLRAGHVGDGQAAREAQGVSGGSVGVVLRGLVGTVNHNPMRRRRSRNRGAARSGAYSGSQLTAAAKLTSPSSNARRNQAMDSSRWPSMMYSRAKATGGTNARFARVRSRSRDRVAPSKRAAV